MNPNQTQAIQNPKHPTINHKKPNKCPTNKHHSPNNQLKINRSKIKQQVNLKQNPNQSKSTNNKPPNPNPNQHTKQNPQNTNHYPATQNIKSNIIHKSKAKIQTTITQTKSKINQTKSKRILNKQNQHTKQPKATKPNQNPPIKTKQPSNSNLKTNQNTLKQTNPYQSNNNHQNQANNRPTIQAVTIPTQAKNPKHLNRTTQHKQIRNKPPNQKQITKTK